MTEDLYIVVITALLPLTAVMLVSQVNPYHALVIRGILGAIAALVYALFGAADVALTEALVGTMLSITLYAVAVRSSLSMRLGVLESRLDQESSGKASEEIPEELLSILRKTLKKYHMRLEIVTHTNIQTLKTALREKEVHTICLLSSTDEQPHYQLHTRISRLYDVMKADIPSDSVCLSRFNTDCLDVEDTSHLTENHV
ncbi:MAG: DUF4040 domain-containing protein [Cyanobacteria bacterium P01_A01_bin.45]